MHVSVLEVCRVLTRTPTRVKVATDDSFRVANPLTLRTDRNLNLAVPDNDWLVQAQSIQRQSLLRVYSCARRQTRNPLQSNASTQATRIDSESN